MHYYKRNIGDYSKKAARLSILQHGIYNLLIDACYDREKFPTREEAIDWIWASSKEEIEGVDFILKKFFERQEDGTFVQRRIAEELEKYKNRCLTNRSNRGTTGDESSEKHDESSTSRQRNDQNQNATKNQEPRTTKKKNIKKKISVPHDFAISDRVREWAEKNHHGNLDQHLENFILTCESKDYKYVNLDSAFMRAIRDDWAKINNKRQDEPYNPAKMLGMEEI
ncbi:MAG: YdaU family protein [Candidatus Thiodiazotropha sp.]